MNIEKLIKEFNEIITKTNCLYIRLTRIEEKLEKLPRKVFNNRTFIMFLAQYTNSHIKYINSKFYNDEDVMNIFIKTNNNYISFKYASNQLKKDKDFIIKAIIEEPKSYFYINNNLKYNKQIIITAIKKGLDIYNELPEYLKKDKDIFKEVLKNNQNLFFNINKIDKDYKSNINKKIMLELLLETNNFSLLNNFPDLIKDKDFLMKLFKNNFKFSSYLIIPYYLFTKKEIKKILSYNINYIRLFPKYRNNKKIIKKLLKKGVKLEYIGNKLRYNKKIVLKALKNETINQIHFIPIELLNDKDVIINILKNYPMYYNRIPSYKLRKDKDIIKIAKKDSFNIPFFPKKYITKKLKRKTIIDNPNMEYLFSY